MGIDGNNSCTVGNKKITASDLALRAIRNVPGFEET
jgi:hypothetical protein